MSKLDDLIKKILIGSSTLSLVAPADASSAAEPVDTSNTPGPTIDLIRQKFDKPKLILKLNDRENLFTTIFHRSHRSHSSHRSHASHYSSVLPSPKKEEEKKKEDEQKSNVTSSKKAPNELGSRLLKKGLKGPDVIELRKLLKSKGYKLDIENQEFDSLLEAIVKDYQAKLNNVEITGEAGPLTIYYLKKK